MNSYREMVCVTCYWARLRKAALGVVLTALAAGTASAAVIFSDNFNSGGLAHSGGDTQYQTGLKIGYSQNTTGWTKAGDGAIHCVDRTGDGNWAIMFYGGNTLAGANTITLSTGIAANSNGVPYIIYGAIGGAVYAGKDQINQAGDFLTIDVLRTDGTTVVASTNIYLAAAWGGALNMTPFSFIYTGNGNDGNLIKLRVKPRAVAGRFHGSLDDLTVDFATCGVTVDVTSGTAPNPASKSAIHVATYGPAEFPEPPTVKRSAEAGLALIQSEWLAQRGTKDVTNACADEIRRTERLIGRVGNLQAKSALDALKAMPASDALYVQIRTLKREIMLSDKQIDFTSLLLIDNPYVHGAECLHEARHRSENTATLGGRLLVVDGLSPDAEVRKLAPVSGRGAFMRPDLSFDAKRVVFCMKAESEPAYHLYEVGLDGTGSRQITQGRYNDFDPIYVPDGGLVFSTSRCNQYVRCGDSKFRMFVLARCDAHGKNLYFISANNETDYTPALLPEGRLLFTRWEYIDREVNRTQGLWTINPDGTGLSAYWGNQSYWPDMQVNARPIPGTQKVICDATGHHHMYDAPLAVIDRRQGMNYPDGIVNLTPSVPWAEVGRGPQDKPFQTEFIAPACYMAFQNPYPFSKDLFLVSARKGTGTVLAQDPNPGWFDLFLMDYDGNMELLYTGSYNCFFAQPVRKRPSPPVIASVVKWPGAMKTPDQEPEWGTLYSADVYEGTKIPRGLAKALRIMEIDPIVFGDCFGSRSSSVQAGPYLRAGAIPGVFLPGSPAMSLVYDEGIKRVIGTVPVEADGSVHFKIPPVRPFYFQLLDENGRCLQTMRSFTHVMPGETRGCVGCHETQILPPVQQNNAAMRRDPSLPKPPEWGDETVGFDRFVQPVLDKYCITCHGGDKPKAGLDLTKRHEGGSQFSWPYVLLVFGKNAKSMDDYPATSIAGPLFPYSVYPNPGWSIPTQDTVPPPLTAMSYRSKLIAIATSGNHNKVKVTPLEEARLVAWVDALCPYIGEEEILMREAVDEVAYFNHPGYNGFTYPPLMKTAPRVHRAFCQDGFESQESRLPKDKDGNVLPSVYYEGNQRRFRIPQQE